MTKGLGERSDYSVTFNGFDTLEQAEVFLDWYTYYGYRLSAWYLENHTDLCSANVCYYEPYVYSNSGISCELNLFYKEDDTWETHDVKSRFSFKHRFEF